MDYTCKHIEVTRFSGNEMEVVVKEILKKPYLMEKLVNELEM